VDRHAGPAARSGTTTPAAGELNWVHAIAEDSHGNLYVGDIIGKRVQKFLKQGRQQQEKAPEE
jgi:hypothetical protein